MFKKAAQVKGQSPLQGDAAAVPGPVKRVTAAGGLEAFQQGPDAGGDRDGVGAGHAALGAGKGDGAGMQVDQTQIQPRLPQTAAGVVADFKTDRHPFLGRIHGGVMGEKAAHPQDLVVRKDRPLGDRGLFGAVVQHGHGVQQAQQASLPVDPFDEFDVIGGEVAADAGAVGAGDGHAPGDVLLRMDGGELLHAEAPLGEEAADPAPAVAVVPFGGFADRMGFDQAGNPTVVGFAHRVLTKREVGGLLGGLGPVEGAVRAVAGGLGGPLAVRGFVPDPVPRTVFSFVNGSHVSTVANHLKTQTNKG